MDVIEKFYADVRRIIKFDRANNASYDGLRASKSVGTLFINQNRDISELANSIVDYWQNTYILNSPNIQTEPSENSITWLAAAYALLDGDFENSASNEEKTIFTQDDWQELCELVNYEAQDLPLDLLTSLMSSFTEHKALD